MSTNTPSTNINIKLSNEEIKKIFKQQLTGSNKDLIADALFGLLVDDWKIERLLKSTLGITPPLNKFPIDALVKIPVGSLSSWMWEKEEMRKKRLIIDDYVEGTISSFDPWAYQMYTVSLKVIENIQTGIQSNNQETNGEGMILSEEWPERKKETPEEFPF